ncbi:MAG: Xaa-Pro peptidase family protein [Candidatus Bathyarchaeia archaeon]
MPDSGDYRIYRPRLDRCQKLMLEKDIDLLFLGPGPNMCYLTGFLEEPGERLFALIVPQSGEPLFVVPELYNEHVKSFSWIRNVISWKDSQDPRSVLSENLRKTPREHPTIAVDSRMWSRFLLMLLAVAPNARFEDASSVMMELRIRKTDEEIELMQKSAEIAEAAMTETLKECREGRREHEVAAKLVYEMRRSGADGVAFEPVVSSGPNAALPHYRSGERRLQRGDLVVLDLGCLYRGYNSDITRTIAIGSCDAERKSVYSIVRSAQEEAFQKTCEGIEAQNVDGIARHIIETAGYGKSFIHRTGHGIGLEVHEDPYIVAGNSTKLADGMAFSIEPGIYIPGQFGVRIEDIVVIESGKVRRLNKFSRELMIL